MSRHYEIPTHLLLWIVILLTTTTFGTAAARAGGSNSDPHANITSQSSHARVNPAIWTKADFLSAIPYPRPEVEFDEWSTVAPDEIDFADGPAGLIPSKTGVGEPTLEKISSRRATIPKKAPYSYPAPFTRMEVFDSYKAFPYRTIGKLFFRRDGSNFVCSAASIGGYGIWTAGHCVHKGNGRQDGWSEDVVFVPAYKNGNAPYGQWTASWLITKTAWYEDENLAYDMGGAILFSKNGRKISERVGALGFAWNQGASQHWNAFGYPAGSPFNDKKLYVCQASYAYRSSKPGPDPVGIGCDMTGGSSGGPWILEFTGTGTKGNYLNGNVSYGRVGFPDEAFSPYFNSSAKSMRDEIISGIP